MDRKTTDVHGSIAGYYYQVLLACRELSILTDQDGCVGVEAGADIRIIKSGKRISVEAKFHKDNMSKFSPDIVKTIYNFYLNSSDDEELIFTANVGLTKQEYKDLLVDNWRNQDFNDIKVDFIKKCLLRHCIEHDTKGKFLLYVNEVNQKEGITEEKGNKYYVEKLESEVFDIKTKEYEAYSIFYGKADYISFSNKLKFIFENQDKQDSIRNLRCQIIENIRKNYFEESAIDKAIGEDIIDALVYEFFTSITYNSMLTKPKFLDLKKVSIKDLKDCIKNYKLRLEGYNKVFEKENILRAFEEEEQAFLESIRTEYTGSYGNLLIESYRKIMNVFLIYIRNDDNYEKLVERYSIGNKKTWNSVLKVITQAVVLSVFNKCNAEKVRFHKENALDNVLIEEVVQYCFKHYDSVACTSAIACIMKLMPKLDFSKLGNEQIIVLSNPNFKTGQRPCDQRKKIKDISYVYDFTTAQQEEYVKYFKYIKNIDYKCDDCILWTDTDEEINKRMERFLNRECGDLK